MLGPFRIRNLRRSPTTLYPAVSSPARPLTATDAVVCVDGDVYEESIRRIPETKLKYVDADRDLVTVGSKDELADRLMEPVRHPSRLRQKQGKAAAPLRPASADMHVFEIDHMEAAIQFWRSMETETQSSGLQSALPQPVEPPLHTSPVTKMASLYPSLDERPSAYFKNTMPPQLHERPFSGVPERSSTGRSDKITSSVLEKQHGEARNVLTSEGIKQAQQAGELLRARLAHTNPYPQRNRVDRTKAVNSWATYSKTVAPMQPWPSSADSQQPKPSTARDHRPIPLEKNAITLGVNASPVELRGKDNLKQPAAMPTGPIAATNQAADTISGSLHPEFFENVQASLDKLSPTLGKVREAPLAAVAEGNLSDRSDIPPADKGLGETPDGVDADFEPAEALEITLAKMVFKTIRDMSKTLESMNEKFDTLLTPKLVEERLKSKDKLLPAHRQDTVRDMFALRRSIENFALEVAETKQTLARLDGSSVFPEGTNLMDFDSMTSAAYSFGRLIRSMDDMIITARRGMLAAQLADGEPKYHTPRRLARLGYNDVWSIQIVPIPFYYSATNVHNLLDEIRGESFLGPLDVRQISFHDGPERSVHIEIEGKARAVETWSCLLNAPDRSIRLPLSERQVTLTRKHYPDVLRCPGIKEWKPERAAVSAPPPPSRADIDVARLKALQDRRAAWRREFKARTQSVRFEEPARLESCGQEEVKSRATDRPVDLRLNTNTRNDPGTASVDAKSFDVKLPYQAETQQKAVSTTGVSPKGIPDAVRNQQSLRRAQSVNFASCASSSTQSTVDAPPVGPGTDFHRLRYPPGPFAPPPPQRLAQRQSVVSLNNPLPYDPTKEARNLTSSNINSKPAHEHPNTQNTQTAPAQSVPILPPLPPLVPLVPEPHHHNQPACELDSAARRPTALPGAWPETDAQQNESSGAFVRRMMGRSPAPSYNVSPISQPTLPATQPSGSIQRPVSPISLLIRNAERAPCDDGEGKARLRRHASAIYPSGLRQSWNDNAAEAASTRRPHSATFDGIDRTGLDLDTVDRRGAVNRPSRAPSMPEASQTRSVPVPCGLSPVAGSGARSSISATPAIPAFTPSGGSARGAKIQECVDQLTRLGYGNKRDGGLGRLLMYVQITDGDIESTIDMIEEEQQAWEAHRASTADGVRDI